MLWRIEAYDCQRFGTKMVRTHSIKTPSLVAVEFQVNPYNLPLDRNIVVLSAGEPKLAQEYSEALFRE
jgi:hypothetical protein